MRTSSASRLKYLNSILGFKPLSYAVMKGGPNNADLRGLVYFYQTELGTLVAADISGLPVSEACGFFGFHIHEGSICAGNSSDPFFDVGSHYNPNDKPHPCHAGDMPPLMADNGYAFMVFLTDRISAEEIIGHTIIVHSMPDDFTTQPSGSSGEKIACGEIKRW